jgi:Zinc carboxypeptidase
VRIHSTLAGLALGGAIAAGAVPQGNRDYRLDLHWNRLHDYDELVRIVQQIKTTWPDLVAVHSIGKSSEGRDLWMLVINNSATGSDRDKPAFYCEANIHGNEVQGGECVLYVAWYLLEHQDVPRLRELLDRAAFYLVPTINPDGRAHWFKDPNNSSSSRSGAMPVDNDHDGLKDEDPPDDLDGDGSITMMRKRVPLGEGDYREMPDHPGIMERVSGDQKGDFVMLGWEGIDNDGDGRINEDGVGGYDLNRNWPAGWNPDYIQFGAGDYPLSQPETRAVADFLLDHPNVAGVQDFHNAGGMILRGPGVEAYGEYPRDDVEVYDELGKDGEFMLPFYRYMVIWKDLYSVSGGSVNWTYEGLGIFSFTNEMMTSARLMQDKTKGLDRVQQKQWDDLLTFGEDYVPWHEVDHPFYGKIEVGGPKKMTGRVPPPWLLEEELHRNAAFVLHHAEEMPEVALTELSVTPAPGGLHYVDVTLRNPRQIPTRSALAAKERIGIPDRLAFVSESVKVIAGGRPEDRFRPEAIALQEHEPAIQRLESGVPGKGTRKVRWIVAGTGAFTLRYSAEKATRREIHGQVQ